MRTILAVLASFLLVLPFMVSAESDVVINEIAWMGTNVSSSDEWLELHNGGSSDIDLTGWVLEAEDGTPFIDIAQKAINTPPILPSGGFFLLERTDDTTVPNISADAIYVGAIGNGGEKLILKDSIGNVADSVDGADNWKIGGTPVGSNETKETAQKEGSIWITADGTPRAVNMPSGEQEEISAIVSTPLISEAENVRAVAPEDIVVTIGKEITLDGSLSSGETFKWYLGDGSVKNGLIVSHTYSFPGQYLVTLEVSNGEQKNIDQLNIFVFGGKVLINEVFVPTSTKENSWIELFNPTGTPINLGGWVLETGEQIFIFPSYTTVLAGKFLVLGEEVTGLRPSKNSVISLSFPNRVLVDEIVLGEVKLGQVAARQNEKFFWTKNLTPGSVNIVVSASTVFNSVVKKSLSKVSEKEASTGENLVVASSNSVEELDNKKNKEEQVLSSSISAFNTIEGKENNLFVWLILTMGFSFVVSVSYILFLRKKHK